VGPAVLPGAGAGSHGRRLQRRHRLFAFVVFRRGAGFILSDGFYLELQQFVFQRYLIVFHCSRIVFGVGRGRFVRRRWWRRGRRRLVNPGCG